MAGEVALNWCLKIEKAILKNQVVLVGFIKFVQKHMQNIFRMWQSLWIKALRPSVHIHQMASSPGFSASQKDKATYF